MTKWVPCSPWGYKWDIKFSTVYTKITYTYVLRNTFATWFVKTYRIEGNFRREIFSEISEMFDTFRKFISEKLLCFCWQRATSYNNSVASSNIPKFYFRNDGFNQISGKYFSPKIFRYTVIHTYICMCHTINS